jgi:hypothetical protein
VLLIAMETLIAGGDAGREYEVLTEAGEETIRVTLRGDFAGLREAPSRETNGENHDLAVCRAIVAAHGGGFWTETAAISFTLPAA